MSFILHFRLALSAQGASGWRCVPSNNVNTSLKGEPGAGDGIVKEISKEIIVEIIKVSGIGKPLNCLWPRIPIDMMVIIFPLPVFWDYSEKQMR